MTREPIRTIEPEPAESYPRPRYKTKGAVIAARTLRGLDEETLRGVSGRLLGSLETALARELDEALGEGGEGGRERRR